MFKDIEDRIGKIEDLDMQQVELHKEVQKILKSKIPVGFLD